MKFNQNIQIAFGVVIILWLIHIINMVLPVDLRQFGLRPRHISSLWRIFTSPFLHGGFGHLMANSSALFVLTLVSLTLSRKLTFMAVMMIMILGGAFTWLFASSHTIHIGASGIIFGLIGFLIFTGIFRHEWKALVISLVVLIFYGGTLFSLLYYIPGISWSGHFFGFFSGIFAAWRLRHIQLP